MKDRLFFKGLQGKLLICFLLVSLLPLSLVTAISYMRAKSSLQAVGLNMLGDMAGRLMGKADALMADRYDDINAWAELPAVREGLKTGKFDNVSAMFRSLQKNYSIYRIIMLFDSRGNLVAANDPKLMDAKSTDRNQADREWFKKAVAGEVVVSDVRFSKTTNENVLSFSAPVKDGSGAILGVITTRVSWSLIERLADEIHEGKTGYAYIVNRDGEIIAHPGKAKILKENLLKSRDADLSSVAGRMTKGEKGTGAYTYEGVSKHVAFTPSRGYGEFKGLGWSFAAVVGDDELFAPIYNLRSILLVILAATALLMAVVALLIARRVANPMLEGVGFAQAVATGDMTRSLEVKTGDEVGELGRALNSMVEGLKGMVGRIGLAVSALDSVSSNLTEASSRVAVAVGAQADGISSTSSAVSEINASVKEVGQGVESLSLSASESSSSILEMVASIEEVALNVEGLAHSVEEVGSSIVEMSASIKQIDVNVQSLMEASTITASSVAEMDASIKEVEKSAGETAAITEDVLKDAETGREAVEATISGISEIKRSSRITSEVIETLSARTKDIGAILSVIDEVTEQTNLLALNAAIIAAQAGEHGKGFAVVADEIKELAERTGSSTREITQVIKGVQDETGRAVEAIGKAEQSIAEGEQLSRKAGDALVKIVSGVGKASDRAVDIARATGEQSKGSLMIRESMDTVAEMVGQIANATREQGKGSELIMAAAERMKELTSQVKSSTGEQNKVGKLIARSTEDMTAMVQQIKRACVEQSSGSDQIVHAVEDIRNSADVSLAATRVMDEAVAVLSAQIGTLREEMNSFKISRKDENSAASAAPKSGSFL